jgi:hypothetical protein
MTACTRTAEQLAGGGPLPPELASHQATCSACGQLARLPPLLALASAARTGTEPAPGFDSRMLASAGRQLRGPSRRRVAATTTALVAIALTCVLLLGRLWLQPEQTRSARRAVGSPAPAAAPSPSPGADAPPSFADRGPDSPLWAELPALLDVNAALAFRADWTKLEAPLAPYRLLLELEEIQ